MEIAPECSPTTTDGTSQEQDEQHEPEQRSISVGRCPEGCQDDQGHTDDAPGDSDALTGHSLGHRPPQTADRDGEADERKDEITQMA